MPKSNKPHLSLEKHLLRWTITGIMLLEDGFIFSHNIRFHSPADKVVRYPTLEELYQKYESKYGKGNVRFSRNVTDKFGGRLPKAKYYRAVYIKNNAPKLN